ncbi:MAG: tail protein X [Magnetococcales bacterium]|nr:tail protein X [Magnetococcales bacterium]
MLQYRTKDDDMLDMICSNHYDHKLGVTETVYIANPGLAEYGAKLPNGLLINLPEIEVVNIDTTVRLWD